MSRKDHINKRFRGIYRLFIVVTAIFVIVSIFLIYFYRDQFSETEVTKSTVTSDEASTTNPDRIENGIHVRTGLVDAEGLTQVVNNCTTCHSAQLIIQNRMSRERWEATIRWMQETQNLWELGANQEIIINYLVENYPPDIIGRRATLSNIEWYALTQQ